MKLVDDPANVLARDQLSTSHRKIADVRKLGGDLVAARAEYVKAVDLGRKLLSEEPTNADVKQHLALALDDQAMTLVRLGFLREASPLARQAEQLFGDLVRADPEDVDNRVRLYQTQFHLGCLFMDQLDMGPAKGRLRQRGSTVWPSSSTKENSTAGPATKGSYSPRSRPSWPPAKHSQGLLSTSTSCDRRHRPRRIACCEFKPGFFRRPAGLAIYPRRPKRFAAWMTQTLKTFTSSAAR